MSTISKYYKKSTDSFCENIKFPGADEIFRMAAEKEGEDNKIIDFETAESDASNKETGKKAKRKYRKLRFGLRVALVAILVLMFGTTALAASGFEPLTDLYRQYFLDDTTVSLASQGYMYEAGLTAEDDNFIIDYIALAGDVSNLTAILDVRFKNLDKAKGVSTIEFEAYFLGEDVYYNQIDNYGTFEGIGYKDENDSSLFHVTMPVPPVQASGEQNVVFDIVRITANKKTYKPEIKFYFYVPAEDIAPVISMPLEGKYFTDNGLNFCINYIDYNNYNTCVYVRFPYVGTDFAHGETDYSVLYNKLEKEWLKIVDNSLLVVDGKKYNTISQGGALYCDFEGESGPAGECTFVLYFPNVDYRANKNIFFVMGSDKVSLKDNGQNIYVNDNDQADESDLSGDSVNFDEINKKNDFELLSAVLSFLLSICRFLYNVVRFFFAVIGKIIVDFIKYLTDRLNFFSDYLHSF